MKKLYDLGMSLDFESWEDRQHKCGKVIQDPLQDEDLKSKKCFTAYQVKSMIAKALGEYSNCMNSKKGKGKNFKPKSSIDKPCKRKIKKLYLKNFKKDSIQ